MREIKFRGKRIDNGEWVFGDLVNWEFWINEHWAKHSAIFNGSACNKKPQESDYVEVFYKTIGEYIEILDAFEGDLLYGCETDEYNQICSSWVGEVKFNDDKGRILVFDIDIEEWYEVDDFMFDKIIGNIHEVK